MAGYGDRAATFKRGLFAALLASVSALLAVAPAKAQSFPTAPVKLICDSAPGSANDVTARFEYLELAAGRLIVFDGRLLHHGGRTSATTRACTSRRLPCASW